jgi:Transposase DDE domain group 1
VKYNLHLLGETNKPRRGKEMIRQTVLPFKIEKTKEKVTARSGLALYGEFMKGIGLEELVDRHMPRAGSGRGFKAITYIGPVSMMLYGGGEAIEEVREIREDHPLREAIQMERIPSSSAIGDWLKRMGERGGIEGIERVNDGVVKKVLRGEHRESYTLMVDPTVIEADKREARMTYLGMKGYRPVVASLKENGLTLAYEFREGNESGNGVEILKKAFEKMGRIGKGKKIEEVILDAEYYSHDVMDCLDEEKVRWAIGMDQDEAVKRLIKEIREEQWASYQTQDKITTDREIAETVHAMNQGKSAFRVIVLRWRERQRDLFKDGYHYHCIATSMLKESPEEVVWKYNGRGQIENHIKEIKSGFGMEWMPSGDFGANAVYFGIGILTYNLFIAQKLLSMPEAWKIKTIKSIRWLLVEVGGKLVSRSRTMILKIAASLEKVRIYLEMRHRTFDLLRE